MFKNVCFLLVQQDPRDLVEIFTGRMPFLFNAMLKEPALVHLLNHLLLQPAVSRHLAPILLQHLVDERLQDLQKPESKVRLPERHVLAMWCVA